LAALRSDKKQGEGGGSLTGKRDDPLQLLHLIFQRYIGRQARSWIRDQEVQVGFTSHNPVIWESEMSSLLLFKVRADVPFSHYEVFPWTWKQARQGVGRTRWQPFQPSRRNTTYTQESILHPFPDRYISSHPHHHLPSTTSGCSATAATPPSKTNNHE
jgi:hypothetical protein